MRTSGPVRRPAAAAMAVATTVLVVLGLTACGPSAPTPRPGTLSVIAAESQYADVAAQVGGKYVSALAIESNPNTDPHSYEVSPSVAQEVAGADVVIENGLGYDDFVGRLEAASPRSGRASLNVQSLLGLPDTTPNPHLWYRPDVMPRVADELATDFAAQQPQHAAYFRANAEQFIAELSAWSEALAAFRTDHAGAPVATTEPVADYLVDASGADNLTPWTLQAATMNGTDPAPQDIAAEDSLLSQKRVQALLFNGQVSDSVTQRFLAEARSSGVPIVTVYETMPEGYSYQRWMLAETDALTRAVIAGASTETL